MLLGRIACLILVLVALLAMLRHSPLFISLLVREKLSVSYFSSAKTHSYSSYLSRPAVVPQGKVLDTLRVSTSSAQKQSYSSQLSRPVVVPQDEVNSSVGDSVEPHEAGRRFSAVTLEQLSSYGWGRYGEKASLYFNKSRCENLTVFFYPEEKCLPSQLCLPVFNYFRHGDILPTALHGESWRVTDKPQEACIFLVTAKSAKFRDIDGQRQHLGELRMRPSFGAAGGPGKNHVYISGGDNGVRLDKLPLLMQAWTSASRHGRSTKCYRTYIEGDPKAHRSGFDVPFPNLPWSVSKPLACNTTYNCGSFEMKDRNTSKPRPVLMFYIGRSKNCPRLRSKALKLHDLTRGMMAYEPSSLPKKKSFLQGIETKAKFLLAPTGNGRGSSFRFFEALSAGGVPVYVGETLEPPFSETLPFEDYAVYFDSTRDLNHVYDDMKAMVNTCNRNGVCEWNRLQSNAIWVYEHYFASDVRAVAGLLELFGRRIRGQLKPVTPIGGFFKTVPGFCIKMAQLERELEKRGNSPPKSGFPVDREC